MPVAIPIAGREGVNPVAEAVVVMRVIEAVRRPAVEIYVATVTRMLWAEDALCLVDDEDLAAELL